MLNDFNKYIDQQHLCAKGDRILLAVSGGIDSMVMLDLFARAGYETAMVHCNFQLRGKASDKDALMVEKAGHNYGLKVFTKKFNALEYAASNKLSVQEAARDLRYEWFHTLIQDEGFQYVAIAQHLDDQVETFFINLLRGSGVTGLKGMPVKRDQIIRPMMFARKPRIAAYAKKHKIPFREDESNKKDTYLRNNIRLNLIPVFERLAENATEALIESMQYINDADTILHQLLEEKFATLFSVRDGCITALITELSQLQPTDIWMYYFLRRFHFNRDVTNNLSEAISNKQSGKSYYSSSHEALIDRTELMIRPIQKADLKTYLIESDRKLLKEPFCLELITVKKEADFKVNTSPDIAQLDKDKLQFPLLLRKWRQGDRFSPLGMKGSKLISDFFTDQKISNFEKQKIWLLVSAGEIAWVVGYRISDSFKVTPKTKQVLLIKLC